MAHRQGFYEKYIKRPQDFVLATAATVVLSPVMLATGLLVKKKLGTPVIFSQERPGLNGKIFKLPVLILRIILFRRGKISQMAKAPAADIFFPFQISFPGRIVSQHFCDRHGNTGLFRYDNEHTNCPQKETAGLKVPAGFHLLYISQSMDHRGPYFYSLSSASSLSVSREVSYSIFWLSESSSSTRGL